MFKKFLTLTKAFSFLILSGAMAVAQPLPKVVFTPVYTAYTPDRPVWMCEAPDGSGRMFVVEQPGRIVILKKGSNGSERKEFFNIVDRHPYFDNEDGLLSIAFHPGFKTNGLFYVYYNQKNSEPSPFYMFRSVISEFHVSATDPDKADMSSERIILQVQQPFTNHKGGEIQFGPDGYLYIGLGDGGMADDPFNSGQNTSTLLAKMLRIDVNGKMTIGRGMQRHELQYKYPPDNPFIKERDMGDTGVRKEIWAYGLRNPWRWSFDRQTGDLWVGDVGQNLWEEVDLIVKGGNYGWNAREAFHYFKPSAPGAQYIDPVIEYPHDPRMMRESKFPDHTSGLCIVGGYVYRGKKYPALQGVYVYGDYSIGTVWGLRYKDGKLAEHGTLLLQPKNISSFAEDADGELYALGLDGYIFAISAE